MIGSIIGDFAGSIYEYDEFKDSKKGVINLERRLEILSSKALITPKHFLSDDTILTVAIIDCIVNNKPYEDTLREYGIKYGSEKLNRPNYFDYMFSPDFLEWCHKRKEGISKGSGSAMRVAPIGHLYNNAFTVRKEAKKSAIVSHNNEDAIKGAEAIAIANYFARKGRNNANIKKILNILYEYSYASMSVPLETLQQTNTFKYACKDIVLASLSVFLSPSSNNFEQCIRNAVSIGGDADTIACIVGGLAEARFGVPLSLRNQVIEFLPTEFVYTINEGYKLILRNKKV